MSRGKPWREKPPRSPNRSKTWGERCHAPHVVRSQAGDTEEKKVLDRGIKRRVRQSYQYRHRDSRIGGNSRSSVPPRNHNQLPRRSKMKCSSPKLRAGIVLSILGVSLIGCTRTPPDPPTPSDALSTSDPFVAPAPNCDKTVTLNHCGAFMPQYNESLGK